MLVFILNTHKEGKTSALGRGGKEHLCTCCHSRRGIGSLICHSGPWCGICRVGGGGDLFWEGSRLLKAPGRQWLLRGVLATWDQSKVLREQTPGA